MADTKPLIRIGMGDEEYTIDKLTLGDARLLKRDYGMEDLTKFNLVDPDVMTGVLVIAYQRANPTLTHDEVVAHVEGIDAFSFHELPDEAESPAEDPTLAGTASEAEQPAGVGVQATTPATPGDPS